MTAPTVSVLVAAYNAEQTIALAVCSALAQTAHLHEVIVVDDASTDRTLDILHGIADSRLRVLRQSARQGPGVARNRAMEAATGQWLAILDADDAFEPHRLERLFAILPHQDQQVVLGDHWMNCRNRGATLLPWKPAKPLPSSLDLAGFLVHKPFLVKPLLPISVREMGIRYPDYFSWEDAVFMCRVLGMGYRLLLHPDPMYLYRLRRDSLSHDLRWSNITETVFISLLQELDPVLDEQGRLAIEAFIHKARNERYYLPVLQALRHRRYGMVTRLLLADRACRHEFLRRLGPSVLQRLGIVRIPTPQTDKPS